MMNGLAQTVMFKLSPTLGPSEFGVKGMVSMKRQLSTEQSLTRNLFIPSLAVWHDMMYSLAAFDITEIPGCWASNR